MFFSTSLPDHLSSSVTLLVGIFAWLMYILQKKEAQREAATIILMEIRNAEKNISIIKNILLNSSEQTDSLINYLTGISILPNNNWQKYNYFFVKILNNDELDYLNTFYNQAYWADCALKRIQSIPQIAIQSKTNAYYPELINIINQCRTDNQINYLQDRSNNQTLKLYTEDGTHFSPAEPFLQLQKYILTINNISTTSCMQKIIKKADNTTFMLLIKFIPVLALILSILLLFDS